MRNVPALFSLAWLVALTGPQAAIGYEVGDVVTAVRDATLRVRDQGKVREVDVVFPGATMRVGKVNGSWLWVSNGLPGWLDESAVIPSEEAVDYFTVKLEREPKSVRWRYARAIAWAQSGEYEIAVADYSQLLRYSEHPPYYHLRGMCHYHLGDYENALADFNEAIRGNPRSARYYNSRALAWLDTGELQRALRDANEAIRRNPKFASAYTNRGRVRLAQQEYEKAIGDFREAIRRDPKYAQAFQHLAWLLATCDDASVRDPAKAIEYARTACALTDVRDGRAVGTLAAAYAAADDFDQAVRWEVKAGELYTPTMKKRWGFLIDLYRTGTPYRHRR